MTGTNGKEGGFDIVFGQNVQKLGSVFTGTIIKGQIDNFAGRVDSVCLADRLNCDCSGDRCFIAVIILNFISKRVSTCAVGIDRTIHGNFIRHLHRHIVGGHKGIASLLTDGCGDIAAIHRDLKAVGLGIAVFQRIAESELLTPGQLRAVVVGATGSIGAASVRLLAKEVKHITLVARHMGPLEELAQELIEQNHCEVAVSQDIRTSLQEADIVITVTSALDFLIEPGDLKPGAVVCDVARPRNVSREVSLQRNDVLVIEGGVINVPGNVDFHFNFGFPPHTSYACMAETMILALDGRYENFSLGRSLDINKINLISQLADKHNFKMAGFRNFERAVSTQHIEEVKHNAQHALAVHGC